MPRRTYARQNRPVTACRECHRRKQKCDRLKPCSVCLARCVPERCVYGDDRLASSTTPPNAAIDPLTPPSDSDSDEAFDAEDSSQLIEKQFGYSMLNDNALSDLQKSIDAIYIPSAAVSRKRPKMMRPDIKARYKKIVAQLPDTATCRMIVDVYFTEANWYFVALDRYYFDRLHAAWLASNLPEENLSRLEDYPCDVQHFPALMFQVLAVSLQFISVSSSSLQPLHMHDQKARDRRSKMYSELGCDLMNTVSRYRPSITSVEHDMMRMSWLKNCSRGSDSWHSIGSAITQAQDLELHLDSGVLQTQLDNQATNQEIWFDEYKRRVWTRLLSLDSYMALVAGRPRHIHLDDCTAKPPTNCDIPRDPSTTLPMTPRDDQEPSAFTFTMFLNQLALKIHEMLAIKPRKIPDGERHEAILQLQRDVDGIVESLPPSMQPHDPDTSWDVLSPHLPKIRQQVTSAYNSFIMQLHRPYVNTSESSRGIAMQAAMAALNAQQKIFDLMNAGVNQQKIYGLCYSTVDAAILLSALVLDQCPQASNLIRRTERSLRQAIDRLTLLKDTSPIAMSGMQLLSQCYAQIQMRHPGVFLLISLPHDGVASEFTGRDTNVWQSYNLPQPQNLELGALPDLYDSGAYFVDDDLDSFVASQDYL